MDKAETNGYLKAVESQMRALESALLQLNYNGTLTEAAEERFRKARADLTNLTQLFSEVRGWNL